MTPDKLKKGDEIRVIAPARGIKIISDDCIEIAIKRLKAFGFKVSFGTNTTKDNWDNFCSTSVENRINDIHEAFLDKNVKAILTVLGGYNSNQLLKYIDYDIIKNNPKIFCGYSDITALLNGIYAKTGLITYSGPHFSSFGMDQGFDYTSDSFVKMLIEDKTNHIAPSLEWSDDLWFINQTERNFITNDGYWIINDGVASGKIIGGNLITFNNLLGSEYCPKFEADTILFIEDTEAVKVENFDSSLQSLIHQPNFTNVKGIVIGRFQNGSKISKENILEVIKSKKELQNMPILANVDFGHTTPMLTIPIGGYAELKSDKLSIYSK